MADSFNFRKYYSDLARLFRSGPVVKQRVANKIASPGSTGVPVGTAKAFLKDVNSAYASTIASYGQYNRLARYSDYCISCHTKIWTIEHGPIEIEKLCEMYPNGERFHVYSYDHQEKIVVINEAHHPHLTKIDMTYKVNFEGGGYIIANDSHNFVLRSGEYRPVKNLKAGDSLMPFYRGRSAGNKKQIFINLLNNRSWKSEHKFIMEYFEGNYRNNISFNEINSYCKNLALKNKKNLNFSNICKTLNINPGFLLKHLRENGFIKFSDYAKSLNSNWKYNNIDVKNNIKKYKYEHKISSIEPYKEIQVYDLTTDVHHNIAAGTEEIWKTKNDSSEIMYGFVFIKQSEMESMGELAAALDIYAEETCSKGEFGEIIKVDSSNIEIRESLNSLFYDVLNIEFNAFNWVRNLCKYGDQFLLIDHHPDFGVLNALPMPINEIEREEGYDPDNPLDYRYRWVTQGNKILENWQVIHFRLLGNDNFLPYGSSLIEPARRVWRQLILMEDAVMLYRIVRSPERRVFYIGCGNVAPQDIPAFMQKAQTQLKKNQVVDSTSGRIDQRFSALCHFPNDFIYLCDGNRAQIKEVAKNWSKYKNSWVWSLDKNHNIVPTKLIWAGQTKEKTKFIEVELDDGQIIRTTHEHRWILRDGSLRKAKDLKPNDSLMPFYCQKNTDLGRYCRGNNFYVDYYHPGKGKWETGHRLVSEYSRGKYKWPEIAHHKNHIKYDNRPDNLIVMNQKDHALLHEKLTKHLTKYANSDKGKKTSSEIMKRNWKNGTVTKDIVLEKVWGNKKVRDKIIKKLTFKIDSTLIMFVGQALSKLGTESREHEIRNWLNSNKEFNEYLETLNVGYKNGYRNKLTKYQFLWGLRKNNFKNLREVKDYYVSIKVSWDKIVEYCELNFPRARREIYFHFGISKHDFLRILSNRNILPEKFDKEYLNGGYYGRHQTRKCLTCDRSFSCLISSSRVYCSHKCYSNWMSNKTYEEIEIGRREYKNHKVTSIKESIFECEAYGLTVENSTHILAVGGENAECLTNGNTPQHGVFIKNSVSEDFFVPVRGEGDGTRIETLPGGQFTGDIEDLNYIQNKLFAALKIPKSYLGYEQDIAAKATLCLDLNTLIPLTDNRVLSLNGIIKEFNEGKELSVYSIDTNTNKIINGNIKWAGITKNNARLIRLWFDNEKYLDCTENHEILNRNGEKIYAIDIKINDSIMPYHKNIEQYKDKNINHKVVEIEFLEERVDVGCLTVDNEFHNFAVDVGIFVGNSQEDVRFAKSIQRVQKVFVSELNKIAIIHLYSMGYKDDDLVNFEISMANPSTIAEMQRLELWRSKFEVAAVAQEGLLDRHFVYRKLFKMTEEDIEAVEEGKRKDKMFDLEVEGMQPPMPTGAEVPSPEGEAPTAPTAPPEAGLPPPPGEEAKPITANKDPNMQTAAPNELIKIKKPIKKKKSSPNLMKYAFNHKKTAMDPKRNYSELTRMVKAPFGENIDDNIEEDIFSARTERLKKFAKDLDNIDILKAGREKKTKKVLSD